jgi:hypothetical protein
MVEGRVSDGVVLVVVVGLVSGILKLDERIGDEKKLLGKRLASLCP